jgi:predicted RNA polymerase sigma factor
MPSPVVDLNRAVAYSMAFGPEAGLRHVDEIADAGALRNYAPLPAAKGDFLFRAGRLAEAKVQFERAAGLTRNGREKAFLLARGQRRIVRRYDSDSTLNPGQVRPTLRAGLIWPERPRAR